jgi:SH3-like domain-containing protein
MRAGGEGGRALRGIAQALAICSALYHAGPAHALEFRSIGESGVVLFDAPSAKATKVFVASRMLPVEVVVSLDAWAKVRVSAGDIAWVEKKFLSETRYVIVIAPRAEVRDAPEPSARIVFEAAQNVVLELEEVLTGWARVRHSDGENGFVKTSQVWGL